MDKPKQPQKELQIDLSPEMATGQYANLAGVAHTPGEFFLDFISFSPNMPKARVVSRVIMSPENVKNLLFALRDNIQRYEQVFGTIQPKIPVGQANNGGNDIPNPFMA